MSFPDTVTDAVKPLEPFFSAQFLMAVVVKAALPEVLLTMVPLVIATPLIRSAVKILFLARVLRAALVKVNDHFVPALTAEVA